MPFEREALDWGAATQMIKIIAIEREYGSGGGELAQLLAKRLGWKLWDQLLTEEIARLADCPKSVVEVREERAAVALVDACLEEVRAAALLRAGRTAVAARTSIADTGIAHLA